MVVTLQAFNGTRCPVAREKCLYNERGHGKAFETCVSVSIVHRTVHHTHTDTFFSCHQRRQHMVCVHWSPQCSDLTLVHWKKLFYFHVHFVSSFLIIEYLYVSLKFFFFLIAPENRTFCVAVVLKENTRFVIWKNGIWCQI